MNSHLLRATEVAERLNVSRSKAFALMSGGGLPTIRIGRSVRVRPEDLEKFIGARISGIAPDQLNTEFAVTAANSGRNQASQQEKKVTYE